MSATTLSSLSAELASVVETASASVVRVEGRRRTASSGVVWSGDGVVVASHHAVDADESVPVGLPDGRTVPARVVGRDPASDLAVLRTEATGLTPARFAASTAPRVGEIVLGLSRPGRSARARLGIVSAAGGEWRTPAGGRLESYLESDVALHPGFSGGLLTSASGEPLGVNSAGLLRGTSLAVPAAAVRRIVEALLARGRVRRGWLGIGTQPIAFPAELRSRLGQHAGLIVLSVQPDGPAARAGILLGDVLLRAGEERLVSPAALLPSLDEDRIGQPLALSLLRAGEERGLVATVGERDAA
jgi:S1-C subfamily serine protease